ncbi:cellulose biosynthesis protein BcsN [Sinorhizobium sp. BG8]|uniref:cellulose biosynthesis protein BcsN n=1 Tax=Sinorhizobium sp. BG8 TaxID=2613773 RepID=UPI00193D3068|nr:cellulose biosynthesis protein BcsN [Sinorhizobium sp. BG8]
MLTGCASDGGARPFENRRIVSESEALILPGAGGPAVVDVVEKRFSNAVEQTVALSTSAATPGQNFLRVQFFGPMESRLQSQSGLSFRPIQESALRSEMRREIPGVALRASDLYLRNDYGPFGYAFGRSAAGDSCLYGWQQLRSNEAERNAFQNSGMVQIRLRLCDSTAGERELLSVMYGYTVNGGFGVGGIRTASRGPPTPTSVGTEIRFARWMPSCLTRHRPQYPALAR